MDRIVDPLLADLQMEYADAVQHGRLWRSRWILVLGYFAFLKTIALCQAGEVMRASRAWTIEDREALGRALKFSAAGGVIATLALAVLPVSLVDCSKDRALRDEGGRRPRIDGGLDPLWDRHRPDVAPFAHDVGDDPVLLSLLDRLQRERQ
jgi:hypothetical protein